MLDTESTRMLAGMDRHDLWGLDQLFADCMDEAGVAEITDVQTIERLVVEWIADNIQTEAETRIAVRNLATVYEGNCDLSSLGHFSGLNDEWMGGWGRLAPDIAADARETVREILSKTVS